MGDHSFSWREGTSSEGAGVPEIGDLIADKYRVEGMVGRGGMGVVLAARHIHLHQAVAVKVLNLAPDDERREEWIARFFHEGRIAAGLQSEHIAQVYDLGLLQGSDIPYMVMELLDGADLAAMLGWQQHLSVEHAVECVRQAASAIALAHRQGIVHRDLKPSNLFVTKRRDGSGLIKVLDFGISKSLDEANSEGSLTSSRAVLGSPFYMSPEQIRDAKRVDHRTDIWSLGAILHELLSGSPPFEADTLPAACAAIVADEPPSIRKLRDDVPEMLERIVLRCLEKNPDDRYNFAGDLVVALQPYSAAARGHAPPRFEVRPSLLEAAARAATPAGPDSASLDAASATLKAALPRTAPAPHESDVLDDASGVALEPSDGGPTESMDAVSVTLASEQPSRTVEDTAPAASDTTGHGTAAHGERKPTRSPRTRPMLVIGAALAFVGVVWFAQSNDDLASAPTKTPSTVLDRASPTSTATFSLLVKSAPNGAEVYENNERLGTTPLALKIEKESVARTSRVFELRRDGYETYYFEQGPSEGDTTHLAQLVASPTAPLGSAAKPDGAASAVPEAGAVRKANALPPSEKARPKQKPEPPVAPAPEPSDIRMSR